MKPTININDDILDVVRDSYAALVAANDPDNPWIVARAGRISLLNREQRMLVPAPKEVMVLLLDSAARFVKVNAQGVQRPAKPPPNVAASIIEAQGTLLEGLPEVKRVVDVPTVVMQPDGSLHLHAMAGLHRPSGTLYTPAPELEDLVVPPSGSVDHMSDVTSAREYLDGNLFRDFTFKSEADRMHAWCLMLLPFVRETIEESTPLHVITAPVAQTGKSWLSRACLAPGCGRVGDQAVPGRGFGATDEWRKNITGNLLAGAPAVVLDNVSERLDSAPLLSALTSSIWTDRVLGSNDIVRLPARNAWVATGNNIQLNDEMATRSVPIELEPRSGRRGQFLHHDLISWAMRNRKDLVQQVLVLLRHWVDGPVLAVNPDGTFVRDHHFDPTREGGYSYNPHGDLMRSRFPQWYGVMTGLLHAIDLPSHEVLNNAKEFTEQVADQSTADEAAFFEAWHRLWGEDGKRVGEIESAISPGGPLHDHVPVDIRGERSTKIGGWLRSRKDRPYDSAILRYRKESREWIVAAHEGGGAAG